MSTVVSCVPLSQVSHGLMCDVVHVSHCLRCHMVSCVTLFHVSHCLRCHMVSCVPLFHVSHCLRYDIVSRLSHVHLKSVCCEVSIILPNLQIE